jgi:RNA polymerase sigma factor (sigma-70 family)
METLFLEQLGTIRITLRTLTRRHAIPRQDAEDFSSWATCRLIENDYAVFRKFRGRSSMARYLVVVLSMLLRDYRAVEWGRWRASAAARRAGTLAVRLETLLVRDGVPLGIAAQILRADGTTTATDRELATLAAGFPRRVRIRWVDADHAPCDAASLARSDDLIEHDAHASERCALETKLRVALSQLPCDDRLILRMHFADAMTIADIARTLALPQKPLYRRLDLALAALRRQLEHAGVSAAQVRAVVDWSW